MANRRFRKTEEAILEVVCKEDYYVGTDIMAKKAGIARSTFYLHHKTAKHILPDHENYLMRKYSRMVTKLLKNNRLCTRVLFMDTLIFMVQNKKIFTMLIHNDRTTIFGAMLEKMKAKLIKTMELREESDKIFVVYSGEITTLICEWAKNGMDVEKIEELLDDIMFLTETAGKRLRAIEKN